MQSDWFWLAAIAALVIVVSIHERHRMRERPVQYAIVFVVVGFILVANLVRLLS